MRDNAVIVLGMAAGWSLAHVVFTWATKKQAELLQIIETGLAEQAAREIDEALILEAEKILRDG